MKRQIKSVDDEVVTKGYLKQELRQKLGDLEFRMINRMDRGFEEIRNEMRGLKDILQGLADQVIGEHKNFEVESVSIKHNYMQLEERVVKVEEIVFPN